MTTARDQIKREELRAMMGDDPDAWLNARLAEAARPQADAGFAVETNRIVLLDAEGKVERLPLMHKYDAAAAIYDRLIREPGWRAVAG